MLSDVHANLHIQSLLQSWGKYFCIHFQKFFSLWLQVIHTLKHLFRTRRRNFRATENMSLFRFRSIILKFLLSLASIVKLRFGFRRDQWPYLRSPKSFAYFKRSLEIVASLAVSECSGVGWWVIELAGGLQYNRCELLSLEAGSCDKGDSSGTRMKRNIRRWSSYQATQWRPWLRILVSVW
jgi:hypothetical protein